MGYYSTTSRAPAAFDAGRRIAIRKRFEFEDNESLLLQVARKKAIPLRQHA
jgi:hypothetical protein